MSSTLLFGLNQPQVKARLWSAAFANGAPPSEYGSGAWDERFSGPEGSIGFQTVPDGAFQVYFSKDGYQSQQYPLDGPGTAPQDGAIEVRLSVAPEQLARLVSILPAEHRFIDAAGQPKFLKGLTQFLLFWRFLRGEDITPVLAQMRSFGRGKTRFNMVRVLSMDHYIMQFDLGMPDFRPQDYPNYYDALAQFVALCRSYGFYVYFCGFPDNAFIMPNLSDQLAHHDRIWRQVDLYEGTNEIDAHDFNWIDIQQFPRPQGVLSCAGSAGEGVHGNSHAEYWDFYDYHQRRDYPQQIKDANLADNPNELMGRRGGLGENDRFGYGGNTDVNRAGEVAGAAMGDALFSVYHTQKGKIAVLFDGLTADGAERWLAGTV